jgi:PadR family transcriptional regulator, regulatory protein PadR
MVRGHLDLLLMSVLQSGPKHGYAVISVLREQSGGEFDLPEGTIYPALHKLERDGLVASSWSIVDGRKRRVYALTTAGRASLAEQKHAWRKFAHGVEAVVWA